MTEKHQKIINWMLSLSREDQIFYADRQLWNIYHGLRERGDTIYRINQTIVGLFRLFVSADLDASQPEYLFFKEVTGIDYTNDLFYKFTNHGRGEKFIADTMKWLESLNIDLYSAVFTFGVYLMISDGPLHKDEIKLVDMIEQHRPNK